MRLATTHLSLRILIITAAHSCHFVFWADNFVILLSRFAIGLAIAKVTAKRTTKKAATRDIMVNDEMTC